MRSGESKGKEDGGALVLLPGSRGIQGALTSPQYVP